MESWPHLDAEGDHIEQLNESLVSVFVQIHGLNLRYDEGLID
jgi:hypothetical protein